MVDLLRDGTPNLILDIGPSAFPDVQVRTPRQHPAASVAILVAATTQGFGAFALRYVLRQHCESLNVITFIPQSSWMSVVEYMYSVISQVDHNHVARLADQSCELSRPGIFSPL